MSTTEEQVYRCQNRTCGCEMRVTKPSLETDLNPRCCCGAEMKKPYTKPELRILQSKPEGPPSSKSHRE